MYLLPLHPAIRPVLPVNYVHHFRGPRTHKNSPSRRGEVFLSGTHRE